MTTTPQLLHAEFQRLTGQRLTLSYLRESTWSEFCDRGLTVEDLTLVITWTRAQIRAGKSGFSPLSMQWRAMVADLDRFEDRLNIARASQRQRPPVHPVNQVHSVQIGPDTVRRLDPERRPPDPGPVPTGRVAADMMREVRAKMGLHP
jgi:hypothetical protein